jgi:L-lactate utilization protein LutC
LVEDVTVITDLPRLEPNPEFARPSSPERLQQVSEALERNGFHALMAHGREEARRIVLDLVPEGAEVHIGLSETMRELGVTSEVEASGRYDAIRPKLVRLDRETQGREIRKLATAPDYMLGSAHAITEDGVLVAASGTGSQLAPYVNGAGKVILAVGSQKIVRDVEEALRRVREYSLPMEDARMKSIGRPGSLIGKILLLQWERPGRITVILIDEPVGF